MSVEGSRIHGFIPEKPVVTSSAMITIALSAIGSSMAPNFVSCCQVRAR